MPIVTITMRKTAPETKKELIEKLTAVAVQITKIPDHHINSSFHCLTTRKISVCQLCRRVIFSSIRANPVISEFNESVSRFSSTVESKKIFRSESISSSGFQ